MTQFNFDFRDQPRLLVDLSLGSRLLLTSFYVLMLLLGSCLMLLVMTFNWPILLMICVGLCAGHLIFMMLGLPSLPSEYRQIAGSGPYLPEPDNCCNKVPSEDRCECRPSAHAGYTAAKTVNSDPHHY